MGKKLFLLIFCAALFTALCGCNAKNAGPLKSLTNPHIAQYECEEATLGGENLLEKFEFIKIILIDKENLELNYKPKDGEGKSVKSNYTFDYKTRRLTAEIGILGYDLKQTTVIEKGKFTISESIGGKQLVMKFKAN